MLNGAVVPAWWCQLHLPASTHVDQNYQVFWNVLCLVWYTSMLTASLAFGLCNIHVDTVCIGSRLSFFSLEELDVLRETKSRTRKKCHHWSLGPTSNFVWFTKKLFSYSLKFAYLLIACWNLFCQFTENKNILKRLKAYFYKRIIF